MGSPGDDGFGVGCSSAAVASCQFLATTKIGGGRRPETVSRFAANVQPCHETAQMTDRCTPANLPRSSQCTHYFSPGTPILRTRRDRRDRPTINIHSEKRQPSITGRRRRRNDLIVTDRAPEATKPAKRSDR